MTTRLLSVLLVAVLVLDSRAEVANAQASSGAYNKTQVGDWYFAPIFLESEGVVDGFLAYYAGAQAVGDNIAAVLYEREGDGTWTGRVWPGTQLGETATYTLARWGQAGSAILRDPVIAAAVAQGGGQPPAGVPEPAYFAFGMSSSDPLFVIVESMAEPGELLEDLRKSDWPVAPQWSAITTVTDILDSGDQKAIDKAISIAVGGLEPIDTCDERVETISLAVTTVQGDSDGATALFTRVATVVEDALFGTGENAALAMFCSGCSNTYSPCVGAGAWTFSGGIVTFGGWNCSWSRPGTNTCASVVGLTWLCCKACPPCPTGALACEEFTGCTVENPAVCPATPAGCP